MSDLDVFVVQKGDTVPSHRVVHSSVEDKYHFEAIDRVNEGIMPVPTAVGTGATSEDKTEPPTFIDKLILLKAWDPDNLEHQRLVATSDPVANALCFGVVRDALGDGWRYVAEYGDDEEIPEAKEIHADFEQCHANYWIQQAVIWNLVHGDSLLYTGPKTFRVDIVNAPTEGTKLDVFSKEYFTLPKKGTASDGTPYRDKDNKPLRVKISPNPENEQQDQDIPYSDFIHFIFDPIGREYAGYPKLYNIWSYITLIRHTAYNIGAAYQKFGMGAIVVFLAGRLTAESKASIKKALKNIGSGRAALLDANLIDRIEYIGPEGSIVNNVPDIIDTFQGMIATGSRYPKPMLSGDSTGQISAGDVQDRAYAGSLDTQIQKPTVKYIKELARRRGHGTDWKVEFNARYAKDEKEEVTIDLTRAQAEDYRASAEAKKKQSEFNIKFSGIGQQQTEAPKDKEQEQNTAGVN